MKLDFYVSKVNKSAMNATILNMLKRAQDMNEKFWVIAPETLSLFVEQKILNLADKKCFTNVQVFSFARLFNKLYNAGESYITSETGTMIVKKVILNNLDKLVCFKKTARTQGFCDEMYATIQQLKSSCISPAEFMAMSATKNVSLAIKMKDIALIYAKYEEFLEKRFLDDSGRLSVLSNLIENYKEIKDINIVLVGHENWTAQMKVVLNCLIKYAKSVTAGVTYIPDSARNSFITTNECFEDLKNIGDNLKIKYNSNLVEPNEPSFLKHIMENFSAYPFDKQEADGRFSVFEAQNPTEEVEFIAKSIMQKIITGNARFKDFAVACGDVEHFSGILKKNFDLYGVSYFIDEPTKLVSHPVVELIQSAINVVRKNYDKDEVLLFVKNIFFEKGFNDVSDFENYILKYAINYGDFKKHFEFGKNNTDGTINSTYLNAENIRCEFFAKFEAIDKKFKKATTFNEFFDCVLFVVETFKIKDKLQAVINKQLEEQFVVEAQTTKQVIEKLEEFIENARLVLGTDQTNIDEFLSVLSAGIASVKISLIPVNADSVYVGDISKCGEIKHLFVLGMQEGMMPASKDDCGIITDGDIVGLSSDFDKKIEPTIKTVNRRERWKFFQGLFSTCENLTFIYSRFDFDGNEVAVSYAVKDVKKLFSLNGEPIGVLTYKNLEQLIKNKDISKQDLAFWFPNKTLAQKNLMKFVSNYKANIEYLNPELVSSLYFALQGDMEEDVLNYFENINIQKQFEQLNDGKRLFFPKGKTSISQIETYFDCPFKHFVEYGLRAKKRDEAGLRALDVGVIVHSVCERFVKYLKKCECVDKINIKSLSSKILMEVLDEETFQVGINAFLLALLTEEAERICLVLLGQFKASNFKPLFCEAKFENGGELEPVTFDGVDVRLEGKIDRVDNFGNMLFVVDYKTGKIETSLTKLYYGKQSQLFVYLQSVKKMESVELAGAFYMPIRNTFAQLKKSNTKFSYQMIGYGVNTDAVLSAMDKDAKSKLDSLYFPFKYRIDKKGEVQLDKRASSVFSEEELDCFVEYVKIIIEGAIEELCEGNIAPSPIKISGKCACDYCNAKWICGATDKNIVRETTQKTKNYFSGAKNGK